MRLGVGPLSLSRRIVASVALGLGLILVLFGLVALWTIQESTDAAYRERVTLTQALARRVDDVLRYRLVTLDREAATLNVDEILPLSAEQIERLQELHQRLGVFTTLSVVNTSGRLVWTEPADRADLVIGSAVGHPSVELALRTRKPAITELVLESEHQAEGASFACLAVPLTDAEGRPSGALMAELDPSHPALALLPSMDGGEGMPAELITLSGRILASNHGKLGVMEDGHRHLLTGFMLSRTAGYGMHEPRPWESFGSHIVAYAPLSLLPWGVVIEQPKDVAVAVPQRIRWRLGIFGLAALLLAAAVAWADVRQVVRPLRYLTTAAERFAAGYLDEPVHLERADELGILARAFETMRQRLRASLAEVAEWNRELERRVANRTAEVEHRNRELAHLNEIAAAVSGSLDVRAMLASTLDHVLQITAADVACFRVIEGESGRLVLAAEHGLTAVFGGDGQACDDACLCERAVRHNTVVSAENAADFDALRCRAANLQSALALPLPAGDRVQGVLFLGWHHAGQRQQVELTTLTAISSQVGIALSNARLYESLRAREHERAELLQRVMAGQEEERRRLAQELHDETSQALASLQLGLERLGGTVDQTGQAKQLAEQLQGIASQTLADVHRLAVELRPSVLDDIGLVAAIERYLLESGKRWNLPLDFAAVGMDGVRLIPAAETVVYRIVQAALTNTVQHAEAKHASVLLERRQRKLVVVVEDDGRGFDLEATRNATLEKRLGLAGMDERAELVGATLTIETAPGAGTTVFLEVPLDPNLRREEADVEAPHRPG